MVKPGTYTNATGSYDLGVAMAAATCIHPSHQEFGVTSGKYVPPFTVLVSAGRSCRSHFLACGHAAAAAVSPDKQNTVIVLLRRAGTRCAGRPRVVGFFDCVMQAELIACQGPYCSISALDRGDDYDEYGVCIAYVFQVRNARFAHTFAARALSTCSDMCRGTHGRLVLPLNPGNVCLICRWR
eukprot:SAG11_NODE_2408_length_3396_cov_2.260843_7_plen_183_part_00